MDPFIRKRSGIELVVDNDLQLGGKTPIGGINWLRTLPIGSIFLVKERNSYSYKVDQYGLFARYPSGVSLLYSFENAKLPNVSITFCLHMVDNVRYSTSYEYICTLGRYSI